VAAARPPRWGWHPLTVEWAERVVAQAPVRAGDVVVDLGAGDGALTGPLSRAGCRVLAVELHPRRAAGLRARYAGTTVAVLEIDLHELRWPGHPFRVVANPPYAGVNALVRRLLSVRQLRSADLVVADGTARGLLRRHGDRLELGGVVPRHAFANRPPAPARIVRLR
jgi:23S rRNA (adenine-N6)-dimethyltransferase